MAKSNYLENKILDHVLDVAPYTAPTTVYVALFTSATDDASGGTEVTGGSYARVVGTFAAASSGATTNSVDLNFPGMPAVTVTHVGIYDHPTAGNRLYHGPLTSSEVVAVGNTASFPAGSLDVTED